MQRSAPLSQATTFPGRWLSQIRVAHYGWAFAALALALAGCESAQPRRAEPLPDPILSTGKQPPAPPPPGRPPPPTPPPRRTAPEYYGPLDTTALIPPGGIQQGRWKVIVIHHSASTRDTPQTMHEYHLRRGWERGLGYHFVIGNGVNYPDGQVFAGPRWKQQTTGAHCKAGPGRYFGVFRPGNFFNENGIGICLIGDFEESSPTPRQIATLKALTAFLCAQADVPPSRVYGHGQVTGRTACPGQFLRARLAELKRDVAAGMARFSSVAQLAKDDAALLSERQPNSGWDGYAPPALKLQLHDPWHALYSLAEGGRRVYGTVLHALDHISDADAAALAGTAGGDIDDDHPPCLRLRLPAQPGFGREFDHAQAPPQHRAAAHPSNPADLAPLGHDLCADCLFAALQPQSDRAADRNLLHACEQLGRTGYRHPLEGQQDVALAEAGPCCGAVRVDSLHDDTVASVR